jgi:hypothetical protein
MSKSHPPKPWFALRVGVTGHGPDELHHAKAGELREKIHEVLAFLKQFAKEHHRISGFYRERDEPILRVISTLAEGADRYVAQEAISLGFELQCPLPFGRYEYANDFNSDAAAREYNRLLDHEHTTAVLALDGSRELEPEAYLATGRVILSQSDVLVTIWNGQDPAREGGTSQIVAEAGLRNILTIRIDSAAPHEIYVQRSSQEWDSWQESREWLHGQLRNLLNPPHLRKKEIDEVVTTTPKDYFSEKQRIYNWGWPWIPLRNLCLGHLTLPPLRVPKFETTGRNEWLSVVEKSGAFSDGAIQRINASRLCDHYGWANGLAEYYGNLYRSAFTINYLMGAWAVVFAFLHFATRCPKWALRFNLTELALLFSIGFVYWIGRRRRWHERWIDYRLLAEYLRQLFFLVPLGPGELSSPHLPKYMSAGDPKNTWMYWQYLALRREIGMIGGEFSSEYLESVRAFLDGKNGIRGQIDYHEKNAERLEQLDTRFTWLGTVFFLAAFAAAFFSLRSLAALLKLPIESPLFEPGMALCATALPAFGAAFAAIRSQGEFERVRKRSNAMLRTLQHICRQLDAPHRTDEKISFIALNQIAAEAGQLMVDELLDWRIVFKERPLPEPG